MSNFAQNLRHLRKKSRFSQEEFANQVGGRLNRGNIASYEKGTAEPKIENLIRIAKYYDLPVIDLVQQDLTAIDFDPNQKQELEHDEIGEGSISLRDKALLNHFEKKAEELGKLLEGFHNYHKFKMKSLGALPKDLRMMVINFEELYEVAEVIMQSHRELIGTFKKRIN